METAIRSQRVFMNEQGLGRMAVGRYPLLSWRGASRQSLRRRTCARCRSCDRWAARGAAREAAGREALQSNSRRLLADIGRSSDTRSVRGNGKRRPGCRANCGGARFPCCRNGSAHYDRGARAPYRCARHCNASQGVPRLANRFDGWSPYVGYRAARRRCGCTVRTANGVRAGLSKIRRNWLFALRLAPLSRQGRGAESRSGSCRIRTSSHSPGRRRRRARFSWGRRSMVRGSQSDATIRSYSSRPQPMMPG